MKTKRGMAQPSRSRFMTGFAPLLLTLLGITLLVGIVGIVIFEQLHNEIHGETQRTLKIIGEHKRLQLERWISQTSANAVFFASGSAQLPHRLERWLEGGGSDESLLRLVQDRMAEIAIQQSYHGARVYDATGRPLFSVGEPTPSPPLALLRETAREARISSTNFQKTATGELLYGLLAPIQRGDELPIGMLSITWSADDIIHPMVMAWPVSSETGEAYLIERAGDQVQYVTPLRHWPASQAAPTFPFSAPKLTAAKALRGEGGIIEQGIDYRGAPVLSYAVPIADTPWTLLAKIDKAEADARINRGARTTAMISALVMLALYLSVYLLWRRARQRSELQQLAAREVRARLASEARIIRSEERLSLATDSSGIGIWDWGVMTKTLYWSDRLKTIFGLAPGAEASYEDFVATLHPDDREQIEQQVRACLRTLAPFAIECRIRRPDGAERLISARGRVYPSATGDPERMLGVVQDITERKRAELALATAKSEAEAATQAKSVFLANMSHEIRTPMNAVLGLAQVLEKLELPAEAITLVRKIRRSGEALLGILNDILDFSKIEAGRLEIEAVPFDLAEVLDNLATIMTASAAGKSLELIIVPPPIQGSRLCGDPLRIGQVLINLTGNAIKFTNHGFVQVKIDLLECDAKQARLCFSVRDTGVGIDTETSARMFAPFVQADASTTRYYGGTGLGLAISRRLVQMMGGELAVDSMPGQGSIFTFTLTLPCIEASADAMDRLRHLRLLIADDNPISLEGLGATVRAMGWTPELYEGGTALLERVLGDPALQSPHSVLLLDWQMPDLDGLEVARRLAAELPRAKRPIILIITAHDTKRISDASDTTAVDVFVDKPLGPSRLYDSITRALHDREAAPAAAPPRTKDEPRLAGLRMLIVDDSEINREVAQRIFSHEGAEISVASNGQEALDWLGRQPNAVDLVLMDVHMPGMDGMEATRRIHRHPALARLPVVALSAGVLQEQRERALAAGMCGFIPKPFITDSAVALILSLVKAPADRAKTPLQCVTAEAATAGGLFINSDFGLKLFNNLEQYHRYLRRFAEQYRPILAGLTAETADPATLKALAHKLRGSAANLGLERVAATASQVETRLQQGADAAAIGDLHEALRATLQAINNSLPTPIPGSSSGSSSALASASALTPTRIDPTQVTPLLRQAIAGLATLDPGAVEPVLEQLERFLSAARLAPIADALECFSFDQAEAALRKLAAELEISLEE